MLFYIYKDGKLLHTCDGEEAVMSKMHEIQPFSMSYAMKHGGYEVTTIKGGRK